MADGLGRTICSQYLAPSRPIPHSRASDNVYVQWVAGALIGMADAKHKATAKRMSLEEVAVTFTTYCSEHPTSTILEAVKAIDAGYRIRRPE